MKKCWNTGIPTSWIVALYMLLLCSAVGIPQEKTEETISLQILTPKTTYRPGERSVVSFTVKNQGATPIYLSRSFICGIWTGYVDFRILNSLGQNVKSGGCDGFVLPTPPDKIKQEVTESPRWLRLDPGEIYGQEGNFDAPAKKGSYRLVAELIPPGLSRQQRQLLASEQIHILESHHVAPVVTIIVK